MSGNSTLNNATLTCNFTSIGQVFTFSNVTNQSVPTIVQQCPDVCALSWGFGNPDLSGIGVNTTMRVALPSLTLQKVLVAYISQAISTALFGPTLIIGLMLAKRRRPNDKFNTIHELQSQFHAISGIFSLSVTVAAIVRVNQGPTLFESSFMQVLLTTQVLASASDFCSLTAMLTIMYQPVESESQRKPRAPTPEYKVWGRRFIKRGLLLFTHITLYSAFLTTFTISWDSLESYRGFFRACPKYRSLKPVVIYSSDADSPFWNYAFTIGLVIFVGALIFHGIFVLVAHAPFVAVPVTFALCSTVGYFTIIMYKMRLLLRVLAGTQYQDNSWQFGQIVSLFLWLPLWIMFLDPVFKYLFEEMAVSLTACVNGATANLNSPRLGQRNYSGQ